MHTHRYRYRRTVLNLTVVSSCCLIAAPALAGGPWVSYVNETSVRLSADASVGVQDDQEKDYAWGDVDHDLDIDLVVARKQGWTTAGGRRNVLFLNQSGVLTDQTATYIPEFLDQTNDRDVILADVNNDSWLDIITAAACNNCNPAGITDDSRLYLNLGDGGGGPWLGYDSPVVLIGGGNNFCGVAAGDVSGDGYVDLFFVSYNDTFEDQLLINEGVANPGSFVNGNSRMTGAMRDSGFGTAAWIVDMDLDGDLDIVKSENGPVKMMRNNADVNFDMLDPTYGGAAYHVTTGFLNGDGLLDLIISDDGIDRYILNNGNLLNGAADSSTAFPGETNGFGSDSLTVDLDNDLNNDVVIADVDVDVPGCTRVSDILRNTGGGNFVSDTANITQGLLTGVHDFAIFDLNGDTFLDIVIGKCDSTVILVNAPPVAIDFNYPNGVPNFLEPDTATVFDVQLSPIGDTINSGTESIFVSINGGSYTQTPLVPQGGESYTATIPAGDCTDAFDFYISAQLAGGLTFTDPATAPASTYSAIAAEGTELLFEDAIEGDVSGWAIVSDVSLTDGEWEQADPNATLSGGDVVAPGSDNTPTGTMAFVTQNGPPGGSANADDVDGGPTFLTSPLFDLTGTDGLVSYVRWAFSKFDIHDFLVVEVTNDAGSNWTLVETVADTGSSWSPASFFVGDFVTPTDQVQVRFSIADTDLSLTEAGIDDFRLDTLSCDPGEPDCTAGDFDGNGDIGIDEFLAVLGLWGPCPGCPEDIDGDGEVGIIEFLFILGNWGPCP